MTFTTVPTPIPPWSQTASHFFSQALLGDRYGYQPIPASITLEDFELLDRLAERYATRTAPVLREWYIEDSNSEPEELILQPIRSKFPNYGDYADEALRREAGNAWWGVSKALTFDHRLWILSLLSVPDGRLYTRSDVITKRHSLRKQL